MNQDTKRHPGQKPEDEGFSLVMSLIFISLLSILVVGFLTSMRTEVNVSEEHARSNKAAVVAQMGTDMALSRLRYATAGTPSLVIWASQPGRIIMATRSSSLSNFGATQTIDLFSGAGNYADTDEVSADINQGVNYLVTNSVDKLRVKWIYLLKDGTLTTGVPVYSAGNTNPPVGRFAFWVDDETGRVNLNTAATRTTSELLGAPSQVNLKAISPVFTNAMINDIDAFRTGTNAGRHYFNTLKEVLTVSSALGAVLSAEKFSLTVNSGAPDLNIFGEPRIVLTTQKRLAGNSPFLDILKVDNSDPGAWSSLDGTSVKPPVEGNKVETTVANLARILMRKDWPILPSGKSFFDKYNTSATASAIQIAVNIIDYVRCKESTRELVDPIRGNITNSAFRLDGRTGTIMGASRALRITERAYLILPSVNTISATAAKQGRLQAIYELYLPKYCGVTNLDLTKYFAAFYVTTAVPDGGGSRPWTYPPGNAATENYYISGTAAITIATPSTSISAGEYRTISAISPLEFSYNGAYTRASIVSLQGGSSAIVGPVDAANNNDFYRIDYVEGGAASIPATVGLTEDTLQTLQVNDPFVNKASADWVLKPQTWTAINANSTLYTSSTTSSIPEQDMEGANVTDKGMQIPAQAGSTTNFKGVVESVAELGYIHSGMNNAVAGTPWRTLRLQPKSDQTTLPDWLLLDMFSAPKYRWESLVTKTGILPNSLSFCWQPAAAASTVSVNQRVGGVINVNAKIMPEFRTGGAALVTRTAALQAAFLGAYTSAPSINATATLSSPAALASSIYGRTLASGKGYLYGLNTMSPLISRGVVAEMKDVTDSSELDENKLRGVVDLLTTQGDIFRIYAVGQVINQVAASTYSIMGESRVMTLVERVNNNTGTAQQYKVIYSGKPY